MGFWRRMVKVGTAVALAAAAVLVSGTPGAGAGSAHVGGPGGPGGAGTGGGGGDGIVSVPANVSLSFVVFHLVLLAIAVAMYGFLAALAGGGGYLAGSVIWWTVYGVAAIFSAGLRDPLWLVFLAALAHSSSVSSLATSSRARWRKRGRIRLTSRPSSKRSDRTHEEIADAAFTQSREGSRYSR